MSRAFATSLAFVAIAASPAGAVVVDSFTTNQGTLADPPGGASVVATAGADILGLRRSISVSTLTGAGPTSAGVSGGTLNLVVAATTPDSRGEARFVWDGDTDPLTLNPTGLAGVDLTAGNHTGFRIDVNTAGDGTELVVVVHTSVIHRSRAALRLPAVAAPTTFHLPFSAFRVIGGSGADFADVGAIELIVRGTETSAAIDLIETAGATLAATKVDLTVGDMPIGTTPQTPGTTVRYRVTVTNTGSEAVNSSVTDTLETNLALASSVDATPVAIDDQYSTPGNVGFSASEAQGLLANDVDPDGGTVTVTTVGAIPTALGGSATVAADGSFTYAPPPGAGPAVDTFAYSIVDGEANVGAATATIHIGDRIWFVDNAACTPAPCGTGTFADPFGSLVQAQNASAARDTIFVFSGSSAYAGGILLKSRQRLIGQGSALIVDGTTLVAAGIAPTIINAAGAGVTLALDNTATGFVVGNTAGAGIVGTSFGTLTASNISIGGNGNILDLDQGTLAATFGSLASAASSVRAIELTNVGGSLTATGTTVVGGTSQGIFVNAAPISASFNFGPTSINGAAGVSLTTSPSTTTTFPSLAVTATAGAGLVANNAGALTIGAGPNSVAATGGPAIDLTSINLGAGATFATVSSTNSASTGINLNTVTGSFTANGGSISGAAGVAFDLNAGSATVTYAGSITNTAGRSIEITARTGGAATLSGSINDTGTGVNIANNTGGTINLSGAAKTINTGANPAVTVATNGGATVNFTGGGLDIDTTAGFGFNATGGATAITVQGSGNSIASTTGTALNVASTTIGAAGLTFQSISSNGGSNPGISVVGTGSTGSLTVTGTGGAGSGGTIANKSGGDLPGDLSTNQGVGIFLNSTTAPSFASMQLNDFQNFAIRGNNVVGFSLTNSVINGGNGNSAAQDEGSVRFSNLTGSASVSSSSISGGFEDNFRLVNSTGTLNRLTFSGTTIGANSTTDGNDGIIIESTGASTVVNVTVENSFFTSARGDLFQLNVIGNSTADLAFTGNTLSNNHPGIATGGGGVTISGGDNTGTGANLTMNMSNNTFRDADGHAILFVKSTDPGTFRATFNNNQIGVAATANSGSIAGSGIKIQNAGLGSVRVAVTNNQIRQYNNFGIELLTGGGASALSGALDATATGNTVSNPGTGGLPMNGIHLNGGTVPGDTYQICTDIGGAGALANSITGSGANGGTDFRLRQRQSTTVRLPGYGGSATDTGAVVAFVQARNGGATGLASTSSPPGGGFVGGAACQLP